MKEQRANSKKSLKTSLWRRLFGNLLLTVGLLILLGTTLARVKIILAAQLQGDRRYLSSEANPGYYLPPSSQESALSSESPGLKSNSVVDLPPTDPPSTDLPTAPEPVIQFISPPMGEPNLTTDKPPALETQSGSSTAYFPIVVASNPEESPPPTAVEVDPAPMPGIEPHPGAGPITRLVIPSLNIDRAVIPVGLKRDGGKKLTWNTDILFSNSNRADLVGQASTSVNPGEGGNIILIGHNYNNGWYSPAGVFINLGKLRPGSQILVDTRDGGEFVYEVRLVKKVPWRQQNGAELEKHHKFMWPTENEQLTLVTCGGANFGVWSARIYVVATPVASPTGN